MLRSIYALTDAYAPYVCTDRTYTQMRADKLGQDVLCALTCMLHAKRYTLNA
jgi:hypothetical protein